MSHKGAATLWEPLEGAQGAIEVWWSPELMSGIRRCDTLQSLLPGPCSIAAFPQPRHDQSHQLVGRGSNGSTLSWGKHMLGHGARGGGGGYAGLLSSS